LYEHTQPGKAIRVLLGFWLFLFGSLSLLGLALGEKEAAIVLFSLTALLLVIFGIIFIFFIL
jgi:hypothetical protein